MNMDRKYVNLLRTGLWICKCVNFWLKASWLRFPRFASIHEGLSWWRQGRWSSLIKSIVYSKIKALNTRPGERLHFAMERSTLLFMGFYPLFRLGHFPWQNVSSPGRVSMDLKKTSGMLPVWKNEKNNTERPTLSWSQTLVEKVMTCKKEGSDIRGAVTST